MRFERMLGFGVVAAALAAPAGFAQNSNRFLYQDYDVGDLITPKRLTLAGFEQSDAQTTADLIGRVTVLYPMKSQWLRSGPQDVAAWADLEESRPGSGLRVVAVFEKQPKHDRQKLAKLALTHAYATAVTPDERETVVGWHPAFRGSRGALVVDAAGVIVAIVAARDTIDERIDTVLANSPPADTRDRLRANPRAAEAWSTGRYGAAILVLRSGGDEERRTADHLMALVQRRIDVLEAMFERGDYLGTLRLADELAPETEGLEDLDSRRASLVEAIRSDDDRTALVRVQRRFQSFLESLIGSASCELSASEAKRRIRRLDQIVDGNQESFVGREIAALRAEFATHLDD